MAQYKTDYDTTGAIDRDIKRWSYFLAAVFLVLAAIGVVYMLIK